MSDQGKEDRPVDTGAVVLHIDGPYRDTLVLLEEARDLAVSGRIKSWNGSQSADRLRVSCESMRITARLTQCMAWLLVQRAVREGELSREEALRTEYRLDGQEVCDDGSAEHHGFLPDELRDLMRRSRTLYSRISRLDQELDVVH